ncbi:MAG: DUF4178 domain-containing protein [Planctomycetota bacterium]
MAGSETKVQAEELRCGNCGAPWELRGFTHSTTVACEYCGAVIEASGGSWKVVQTVERKHQVTPRFPLGTRGKLDGVTWEVIGWQRRKVMGWPASWEEHVCFNPYEGVRYLLYSDGHWAWVTPLPGRPAVFGRKALYAEQNFRHFTKGKVVVDEVLGEFPWQVRRGDVAEASDYVDPPHMLSCETSEGEEVWSKGRYLERDELEAAFGKPSRQLRNPRGVYLCQPNPDGGSVAWYGLTLGVALCAWFMLTLFYVASCEGKVVGTYTVPRQDELSVPVEIESGRRVTTLEISGNAGVDNSWAYVDMALIGPVGEVEQGRPMGLEISYYHGYSGGESWSEGSQSSTTVVGSIPNGKYILQARQLPESPYPGTVQLTLRRDVALARYPIIALLLILVIPVIVIARYFSFEKRRWGESDYSS